MAIEFSDPTEPDQNMRVLRAFALFAILASARASDGAAQSDSTNACFSSSSPTSSIAWESLVRRDNALKGRVIGLRDLRPVTSGVVRLEPGTFTASLDSSGAFQFSQIRPGRYLIRVQGYPYLEAKDSITVGQDGLFVLAAMAARTPDIMLVCPSRVPARKPSNER